MIMMMMKDEKDKESDNKCIMTTSLVDFNRVVPRSYEKIHDTGVVSSYSEQL